MNKTDYEVKSETFIMNEFQDEDHINGRLEELGFDLKHTTWIYSWTVPSWVPEEKSKEIVARLEKSDYRSYLVNVRQETPK